MCAKADSCPNLYAESDCVSSCEVVVAEAAELGGTCPRAVDNMIACHKALSCTDLTQRAISNYHVDECTPTEQSVRSCEAGDPVAPGDGGNQEDPELPPDELALACDALCQAIDSCPTTRAESDCLEVCVTSYGSVENGSSVCRGALIDTLNCQAAMTCGEIENRVRGYDAFDSCREADDHAAEVCLQ
jgi:hypothetical protein